jgi:hypothetical protein
MVLEVKLEQGFHMEENNDVGLLGQNIISQVGIRFMFYLNKE